MSHVILRDGRDLGEVTDPNLLAYYAAEGALIVDAEWTVGDNGRQALEVLADAAMKAAEATYQHELATRNVTELETAELPEEENPVETDSAPTNEGEL